MFTRIVMTINVIAKVLGVCPNFAPGERFFGAAAFEKICPAGIETSRMLVRSNAAAFWKR